MAIYQISKIIHRTGANVDLPQLDIGEIGFATDEQRVYIGNDPNIVPPVTAGATTQTEILTTASPLDFSRLNGSSNASLEMNSPENGQLLGINVAANITTVVNVGGNVGGEINLGQIDDVRISGGVNGYVLQTDGTGNLTWTTNGSLVYKIQGFSAANGSNLSEGTIVTTSTDHFFGTGTAVTISGVLPSGVVKSSIETAGFAGTNLFYTKRLSNTTFSIHDEANVAASSSLVTYNPIWTGYTANSANILGQIAPVGNAVVNGSNTQLQFNDAGSFGASANLTFNKVTNILTVSGNVNATTLSGNVLGSFDGLIGCTTPNLATFTSVTVVNNANVVGNIDVGNVNVSADVLVTGDISVGNVAAVDDVTANNVSVVEEISGNILSVNTANLLYDAGANSWSMFANADGIFLTDSGSGNTFQINLTQI